MPFLLLYILPGGLNRMWQIMNAVDIRLKIMGMVLGLTVTLGLSVTLQVRAIMTQALIGELDDRGYSVTSDLAARSAMLILEGNQFSLNYLLTQTLQNHPDIRYAFVVDEQDQVLAHTFEGKLPPDIFQANQLPIPQASAGDELYSHVHYDTIEGVMHDFAVPILQGQLGYIRMGLAETRLHETIDATTRRMLGTTLAVSVAGILGALVLTWLITRPILDLVQATADLRGGNLRTRAPRRADDEIGVLADSFNAMVSELEVSQQLVIEKEAARTQLLSQIIRAQEEERKRIARELHDGVGQALTSMLVRTRLLNQATSQAEMQTHAEELRTEAAETLAAVRLLSRELRPSALDDLGLTAALDRYVGEFATQYPDLTVDLHAQLAERLPSDIEITLYRIIQEAMTNTARHSDAHTLSVLVSRRDGRVHVIVEDDGHGFDVESTRRDGSSVGIHSMTERAELLGGHMAIESSPSGTGVYIEIPLGEDSA
ncbi:MAG: histidine kinase [Litorilinea sp.]